LHSFLLSSGCSRHGTKKLVPSSGRSHGGPRSSSDRTIGLGLGLGLATLTITCTTTTNNPSITHAIARRRRLLQIKCKFVLSLYTHTTTTCVKAATPIYTDGDQQLDQSRRSTLHLQIKPHHIYACKKVYAKSTSIDCKNEERILLTIGIGSSRATADVLLSISLTLARLLVQLELNSALHSRLQEASLISTRKGKNPPGQGR